MFPASPVIYMRRDPRDVCLSIYSREFQDGHNYACDLEWLGDFYSQSVSIMECWLAGPRATRNAANGSWVLVLFLRLIGYLSIT